MAIKREYLVTAVAATQRTKANIQIVLGVMVTFFFGFGFAGGIVGYRELREGVPLYFLMMIPGLLLLWRGIVNGSLASAARRFETIFSMDTDGFVTIDELTRITGRPADKILKDLEAVFRKGYFRNCTLQTGRDPKVILSNAEASDRSGTGFITVTCVNCGGKTRIRSGSTGVCDYCGGPIRAE